MWDNHVPFLAQCLSRTHRDLPKFIPRLITSKCPQKILKKKNCKRSNMFTQRLKIIADSWAIYWLFIFSFIEIPLNGGGAVPHFHTPKIWYLYPSYPQYWLVKSLFLLLNDSHLETLPKHHGVTVCLYYPIHQMSIQFQLDHFFSAFKDMLRLISMISLWLLAHFKPCLRGAALLRSELSLSHRTNSAWAPHLPALWFWAMVYGCHHGHKMSYHR